LKIHAVQPDLCKERVLRTDERGTIEVVTDGERIWIRTG